MNSGHPACMYAEGVLKFIESRIRTGGEPVFFWAFKAIDEALEGG